MRLAWIAFGALAQVLIAAPAGAGDKVVIMVGGIEKQIYLPAKLAEQLGYFKEQGLVVELQSEPSGAHAEDQLLAGAVQGVTGFYDHTIQLQAKGKAVESVVQLSHAPGEVALIAARAADAVKSPADFRARTIGVTGLGSSTHFLSRYLAVSVGVKPSEMTFLSVGSGDTFIAAMRKGTIDVGMTTEPTVSRLLKTGEAKVLVDLRSPQGTADTLGGLYPSACLYMQTAWVNTHRPVVQKLVNAFVKTLRYIDAHSAEDLAALMPAEYYAGDRAMYERALAHGKVMFTADGRMPESGPATVLKVLSAVDRNIQGKRIDLSRTFTSEFVTLVP